MKKQRKSSYSFFEDSIPLIFKGDSQLFTYMNLKFESTLTLFQKQYIISLPLKTFSTQIQDFIEPMAIVQTVDELTRESMLKNKSSIKQGVFYVYFPSNIRVDEKIFKIYDKHYESFIKDVPKNVRMNFAKFIIFEEGTGENNLNYQKQKVQQLLSNCIKVSIEKKIETYTNEISKLQNLQLNSIVLRNLFVTRNKIASIYRQIKLNTNALEHLSNLFNDILYNFKKLILIPSSTTNTEKTQYKSPFITKDINLVHSYFESKHNFLQISNFCFLKMFEIHLDLVQQFEGMKKFKQYLDFVLANVLNVITSREEDVARNIWMIETIDQVLRMVKARSFSAIMNPQKEEQYSLLNVSVVSQYRSAIQRIGVIYYGLNTYCVFPRNLEYQLTLCIKSMNNQPLTEKQYPQLRILNRHQQINKLLFLSGQAISDTIELVLNNFQTYKLVYVKTLELMQKTLSDSPYKKVSWSMKLSVLKSTIIYFAQKDEKRMSIASLLQENKVFSYESKKSVWQKLQIVNKVYQLTLCKRYNIKMRVEDLLNIILDDSIIHLQKIWIELVRIISQLLFEYKKGESEEDAEKFNTIDFGQGQNDDGTGIVRKRRRTTIHYETKQIQVGTLKFISLVDSVMQNQNSDDTQKRQKKNDSIRLNIQLSNRIISYALALIQKSKAQHSQQKLPQKPLIDLKFKITTQYGQQSTIPFQIIQTQDKFIEVEIKSSSVILFTIDKLLIDISDSITLVYTMPINHEKIQYYGKKKQESEENFYVNISPELKINTLQLFQPVKEQPQNCTETKFRKESTSSTTSRQNSQSSFSGSSFLLYQKLWTPLKFMFSFHQGDQIQIQKIQLECQDEINDKVFLGQRQHSFKQIGSIKFTATQDKSTFPLIIFVKPSEKSQTFKQGQNFISAKKHKQSFSIIPKSLRNRAQSFSRSVVSGGSGIDSNRVSLKLLIKHKEYTYDVRKEISYKKRDPFKVDYRYSQEFQEYTVKNLTEQQLQITSEGQSFDLYPYEELKVFSPLVSICLKYHQIQDSDSQSEQQELNIMKVLKLDQKIDLKTMIKKEHLKPQKLSTIWLRLEETQEEKKQQIYPVFQPIKILAQQSGYISVLKWNTSEYELVGKIQGQIQFTSENQLDLMIIPTKKGNISMPQISINSKKGIWKNGKRIKVG